MILLAAFFVSFVVPAFSMDPLLERMGFFGKHLMGASNNYFLKIYSIVDSISYRL